MFAKSDFCPECELPLASDGLCEDCDAESRCDDCETTLCSDGTCPCCDDSWYDICDEDLEELDEILARLEAL